MNVLRQVSRAFARLPYPISSNENERSRETSEAATVLFSSLPGCLARVIAWSRHAALKDADDGSAGSPGRPATKQI